MEKKNKKNRNIFVIIKTTFLIFLVMLSFVITVKGLNKINLEVDDLFLISLIDSSNNLKGEGFSSDIIDYVIKLDFFDPTILLKTNYKGLVKVERPVVNEIVPVIKEENSTNNDNSSKAPLVYIYNTHQTEEYDSSNLAIYNIKPTVMTASYMLQDNLKKHNILSIVEERSINSILHANNWNYASSYVVSKSLMADAKKKNSSLTYFVDLHRDSVSKDITTVTIGNKKYAKVMFLLGLENKNYKESESVIKRLNEIITSKYPGISRGIYKKGGPGVNGVYNQDFSSRCILIEVGGVGNMLEEVSNTIDAITDMLITYIKEDHE